MESLISNQDQAEKEFGRLEEITHRHNIWENGKDLSGPPGIGSGHEIITTVVTSKETEGVSLSSLVISPAGCRNLLNKNEIRDFLEKHQGNMSQENIADIKNAFTEDQIRGFSELVIQEHPGSQYKFETREEALPEIGEVHFHYDAHSSRQNERRVMLAYEKVPHFKEVGKSGEILLLKLGTGEAMYTKDLKQDFLNLVEKYKSPLKKITSLENGKSIAEQMGGVLIKGFGESFEDGSEPMYAVVQEVEDEYDAFPDYHEDGDRIKSSRIEFVSDEAKKRYDKKGEITAKARAEIPSLLPSIEEETAYNNNVVNNIKG